MSVPIRRPPRLAGQCFGGVKGCALEEMEKTTHLAHEGERLLQCDESSTADIGCQRVML